MDTDKIISALIQFFVGLDLGQRCDHSALVVVERAELFLDEMDWVTYERRRARRYRGRATRKGRNPCHAGGGPAEAVRPVLPVAGAPDS